VIDGKAVTRQISLAMIFLQGFIKTAPTTAGDALLGVESGRIRRSVVAVALSSA
jgi:hypothetical protein